MTFSFSRNFSPIASLSSFSIPSSFFITLSCSCSMYLRCCCFTFSSTYGKSPHCTNCHTSTLRSNTYSSLCTTYSKSPHGTNCHTSTLTSNTYSSLCTTYSKSMIASRGISSNISHGFQGPSTTFCGVFSRTYRTLYGL